MSYDSYEGGSLDKILVMIVIDWPRSYWFKRSWCCTFFSFACRSASSSQNLSEWPVRSHLECCLVLVLVVLLLFATINIAQEFLVGEFTSQIFLFQDEKRRCLLTLVLPINNIWGDTDVWLICWQMLSLLYLLLFSGYHKVLHALFSGLVGLLKSSL